MEGSGTPHAFQLGTGGEGDEARHAHVVHGLHLVHTHANCRRRHAERAASEAVGAAHGQPPQHEGEAEARTGGVDICPRPKGGLDAVCRRAGERGAAWSAVASAGSRAAARACTAFCGAVPSAAAAAHTTFEDGEQGLEDGLVTTLNFFEVLLVSG